MQAFAKLLDTMSTSGSTLAKRRLMAEYFKATPDPERGWVLAALGGHALISDGETECDSRAGRKSHRSGALRTIARLCRRHGRNRGAHLAQRSTS